MNAMRPLYRPILPMTNSEPESVLSTTPVARNERPRSSRARSRPSRIATVAACKACQRRRIRVSDPIYSE
jgi:hypothetical protein